MSTSLKVVSIAAVFCASFRRRAMVSLSLDIFTRSSRAPSAGAVAGRAAGAGAGGITKGFASAMEAAAGFSSWAMTSPLVTRPSLPVPGMPAASSLFSAAILRTAGDRGISALAAAAGAGSAFFAAGASAAFAAAPAAPSSIIPSSAPTLTVVPGAASIDDSFPEAGAGTSTVTLSVSSSTSGSSTFTASPACRNHFAIVASVTDSPKAGTRISFAIVSVL